MFDTHSCVSLISLRNWISNKMLILLVTTSWKCLSILQSIEEEKKKKQIMWVSLSQIILFFFNNFKWKIERLTIVVVWIYRQTMNELISSNKSAFVDLYKVIFTTFSHRIMFVFSSYRTVTGYTYLNLCIQETQL